MAPKNFVSKTRFFALLGICFATGERMLARQVLKPAGILDGEHPLFIHSGESVAEARQSMQAYRAKFKLSKYNINQPN
jgi:hypothetical protein